MQVFVKTEEIIKEEIDIKNLPDEIQEAIQDGEVIQSWPKTLISSSIERLYNAKITQSKLSYIQELMDLYLYFFQFPEYLSSFKWKKSTIADKGQVHWNAMQFFNPCYYKFHEAYEEWSTENMIFPMLYKSSIPWAYGALIINWPAKRSKYVCDRKIDKNRPPAVRSKVSANKNSFNMFISFCKIVNKILDVNT